ncbi:MAG TPA: arylesterase [Pyrinomonadaceae bacterium]|nr:arylesterase [Pyrinomonadaceae bacterium]
MKSTLLFFSLFAFLLSACGRGDGDGRRAAENAARQPAPALAPKKSDETLPKIVAFGDSLTAGYGLAQRQSYPSLLQEKLRADGFEYEVVNAGVSGETTAGGLRRLDWSLDAGNVRFLVLELGANDFLRGQPVSAARENLSKMIARAQGRGVKVLLAGMLAPTSTGREYQKEIAEAYSTLAEEHDVPLIPFFLEGVAGRRELNLEDGIHPNAEGQKIIADLVYRHLKPMLEEDREAAAR